MYLVVCSWAAVPGRNAMCYESPYDASGGLAETMCQASIYAEVCLACPSATGRSA